MCVLQTRGQCVGVGSLHHVDPEDQTPVTRVTASAYPLIRLSDALGFEASLGNTVRELVSSQEWGRQGHFPIILELGGRRSRGWNRRSPSTNLKFESILGCMEPCLKENKGK